VQQAALIILLQTLIHTFGLVHQMYTVWQLYALAVVVVVQILEQLHPVRLYLQAPAVAAAP
jgi:hypothetical protein